MPGSGHFVLDDVIFKHWDKSGKNEFMKLARARYLAPSSGSEKGRNGLDELKRMIYDLIWKGVRGVLKRDQVANTIGEMVIDHQNTVDILTDVFCLVDTETGVMAPEKKDDRERFIHLVKEVEKFLSEGTLKERMEIDTLGEVGILKDPKKFFSAVIKLKTKLFYKQQKFNLLREESEGFAKLIVELNQDLTTSNSEDIMSIIKSIIGYFNLDPNRVLDLILESFECQLEQHKFFIELLDLYKPDTQTLLQLLGFKYKFYMNETEEGVPESLFQQTALMIQYDILDMESIYDMLGPSDDIIKKESENELKSAQDFVKSMTVLSTKDKTEEMEIENEKKQPTNQKFGLLEALITVGAWNEAEAMIAKLPAFYTVSQPNISAAIQRLIHITMHPLHLKCSSTSLRIVASKYKALDNKRAPKQAETFEDFKTTVIPMLKCLGPYTYSDPVLLYKVLRILKAALGIGFDESGKDREKIPIDTPLTNTVLYYDVLTLMNEVFLPSLALTEGNCALAEEIWTVLRIYPYDFRYRLYGLWRTNTYNVNPQLLRKKAAMQKSIKGIMKRVSKENVKPTSRQLGKLTHSSPGLLFEYILSQLQLYDNLIGPVVDSFKYLTSLSFDVLGYSIIEALNNPEKDRTKHDGTSISLWLQSLSNFCGAIYKKYNIDLTGVLQYVANQLKNKKSLDLLIMKEVVLKMGGIEAAEEMTDEQIDAMSGGELLRQEAGSFNQIKNTRKSSQRLKDALIDNNLAVPLCLLMAQQRNCVVYQETEDSHLKLVGKLFDQCQDTLVQFGTFLASNLSIGDYTHRLPPIKDLLSSYHVNLDLAFFLARPMFNHQISLKFDEMKLRDKTAWKSKNSEAIQAEYVKASLDVMKPVTDAIRPLHPSKIWDDISPQFLTTFWSLTMYDLSVPEAIYSNETSKLKAMPSKIDENKELNSQKKKKEKERIHNLMDKLNDEQKRQKDHVEKVFARLKEEKDSWFLCRAAKTAKNETITAFLQLCLFPRCIFTASDAIYCAKFVQIIHMLKTPNFSTLICLDRIFCDITYTVTSCTENEAHRYGRFLAAMLQIIMKWHSSELVFNKECAEFPGFVAKQKKTDNNSGKDEHVNYEDYRHVCHKWHYKIAKALVVCLESQDYVQIRNALTILSKVLPHFPVLINLGTVIERRIEKVAQEEKDSRKDLSAMATSYMGQFRARKQYFIKEDQFHLVKKGANVNNPSDHNSTNSKDKDSNKSVKDSNKSSKDLSKSKDSNKSAKNSVEREGKSQSRSQSREKSSHRESKSEDRKLKKDRESKSRERSAARETSKERHHRDERKSSSRSSKDVMGPPSSTVRKSVEPSEDRDSKKRKLESSPIVRIK